VVARFAALGNFLQSIFRADRFNRIGAVIAIALVCAIGRVRAGIIIRASICAAIRGLI